MRRLMAAVLITLLTTACSSTQKPNPVDKQSDNGVEFRVRESSASLPDDCTPQDVRDLVIGFLDAFNSGHQEKLKSFFGEGFEWFSVTTSAESHVAIYEAADVFPYFAARHEKGEQLKLQKLEVNAGSWHGGIDIVFSIDRVAEDLPKTINAGGKGMVNCKTTTISVWSMGSSPTLHRSSKYSTPMRRPAPNSVEVRKSV